MIRVIYLQEKYETLSDDGYHVAQPYLMMWFDKWTGREALYDENAHLECECEYLRREMSGMRQ